MLTQLHGRGLASLGKVLSLAERWTVDFRKLFLCRFVQTGLLRQEITRLGASNQTRIKNQRFCSLEFDFPQHHITGDISFAFRQYLAVTGDTSIFSESTANG